MDIMNMIQLALFVPGLVVLAICAIIYLIAGYKKGFRRSLLSLAASVIAAGVSLLLTQLVSGAISGVVNSLFPAEEMEALRGISPLAVDFAQGLTEIIISFFLFGIIFFVLLLLLKFISNRIAIGKPGFGKIGSRVGGMAVRAVDALLVTVMMMLPLYGIVATLGPPAAIVTGIGASTSAWVNEVNVVPQKQSSHNPGPILLSKSSVTTKQDEFDIQELSEALEAAVNHPMLLPYKYGPGAWACSGLSSFRVNDQTLELSAASKSLEGLLRQVQDCRSAIETGDAQTIADSVQNLVDYIRNNVIHQRWSYNLVMALVSELDTVVEQQRDYLSSEETVLELYDQLSPLLDMTFEEYTGTAEALLDFIGWVIETYNSHDINNISADELAEMEQELYTLVGDLLNLNEQTVGLKRILLQNVAQCMFDTLPDYGAARQDLPNSGVEFVHKYFGDGIVAEEDRMVEAGVFLSLWNNPDALDVAEAFVRHPLFGADAVLDTMDEYLYINSLELAEDDYTAETWAALDDLLRSYEQTPYNRALSFSDAAHDYLRQKLSLLSSADTFLLV